MGHVRYLTETRDALATEFEKENEQLRMEFMQLQLGHGNLSLPPTPTVFYSAGITLVTVWTALLKLHGPHVCPHVRTVLLLLLILMAEGS